MPSAQEFLDGFMTLEGGVDSGRAPELISPNQISYAINTTFRGSFARTRPGFRQPSLSFDSDATSDYFTNNRIQGSGYYNVNGTSGVCVISAGGKIFEMRVRQDAAYLHDITPIWPPSSQFNGVALAGQVDRNSVRQPRAYFQQADKYLVIQDGLSKAIIYDGATCRRAAPTEVPVGTCMAYGLGRLVVAQGNQFVVGDILGGPTSVVSFTETTFLNEGGAFSLPADMGNIVGMIFTAKQDTATGQGILLVFAEKGVASVDLSQPRANWKSSAIQQVALVEIGATSGDSLALVNGDVFFRSKDGIRTYRDSRAQQLSYGRTPISYEINRILDYDTPQLLDFVSAVNFDNRYLMTVSPMFNNQGAIFQGLAVMDFTPVTSTRTPSPPSFDGLWTGISPVALVAGKFAKVDRCFAFCTDANNGNEVWEITKADDYDNGDCPIQSVIETKAFSFGDLRRYKNLQQGLIWISQLLGPTDFNVLFRPDQYPLWAPWSEFTLGQPLETCNPGICQPWPVIPPQYRPGHRLPNVPDAAGSGGSTELLRKGFSFTVRIEWTGHAEINRLLLNAVDEPQLLPGGF